VRESAIRLSKGEVADRERTMASAWTDGLGVRIAIVSGLTASFKPDRSSQVLASARRSTVCIIGSRPRAGMCRRRGTSRAGSSGGAGGASTDAKDG
jgi:hypothetical protein